MIESISGSSTINYLKTDYIFEINKLIDEHKINYALPINNPLNILDIPENHLRFTISDDTLLDLLIMKLRDYTIQFSIKQKKNGLQFRSQIINRHCTVCETQSAVH